MEPKYMRFGDFVRQQMADKRSELNERRRILKSWINVCKSSPKDFRLRLNATGFLVLEKKDTFFDGIDWGVEDSMPHITVFKLSQECSITFDSRFA